MPDHRSSRALDEASGCPPTVRFISSASPPCGPRRLVVSDEPKRALMVPLRTNGRSELIAAL